MRLIWICLGIAYAALAASLASAQAAEQPNILWINAEDMSPHLGCYGHPDAVTPNIDRLAAAAVVYRNAFATAPICSPARSCLATGPYATRLGTQHLRCEVEIPERVETALTECGETAFVQQINAVQTEAASTQTAAPAQLQNANDSPPAAFTIPAMWDYSGPLIAPEKRERDPSRAQKDPTVVFHDGKWHVFMTVKLPGRSAIEHCSFAKWEHAHQSKRTILKISDSDYYCAPQVFYFTPHQKWYLVYQMGVPGADKMWVAYSTTSNIADPDSWTRARPILDGGKDDPREVGGLDYWIICDDERAYLFLASLNGKMWRLWTNLEDFPRGFDHCTVALQARIFEASHTYRLKGMNKYLTVVEENGRRYYKAYLADRLDGEWTPIADSPEKPFASWKNIRPGPGVQPWTDNVSHGELIRDGVDQTLSVDPGNLRFVFQGMLDAHKSGKGYGQFDWRIGMLTPSEARTDEGR